MSGWSPADLLPGLYVLALGGLLALALRRWYDAVPRRVWAVFAVLLVVLFGRVLFGGGVLLPLDNLRINIPFSHLPPPEPRGIAMQGDLVHQIAPWLLEVRRAVSEGRWPLWSSRTGAGMPLLGDPQAQVLQPLVLLAYPFDLWSAVGITAALRVLLALVFLFLLLRRQGLGEPAALCGSLAFGLGGFLMLWLGWPMANSAALLPLALYAVVRCDQSGRTRDHLLLTLAAASLLLGGHPETFVYALAFTGLFLLARCLERWRQDRAAALALLRRCALSLILAGFLVAPVLLPIQDYLPKTNRGAVVAYQLSFKPLPELWRELQKPETLERWRERAEKRLVPVAAPRAFGRFDFPYWGLDNLIEDASGFAGSATLLLALLSLLSLFGKDRLPQERLAGLTLLAGLALIAQPPGFERLAGQLPVIGATAIHRHHRILLLVCFCLAYLAACEVERRRRGEGKRWPVIGAMAVVAALIAWGYLGHPHPEHPRMIIDEQMRWLALQLGAVALAAATLLLAGRRRWLPWGPLPWAIAAVVAIELLAVHLPAVPPAPRRLAYPVTPPIRFLLDHLHGTDGRMVGVGQAFLANFPAVYGLNDARIDNPSLPDGYAHVTWTLRRQFLAPVFSRPSHPLYDLLGVRYVIVRPGVKMPLPLVFQSPAGWIYQRPRALPRLFLPASAEVFQGGLWGTWLERNRDFAARALVQPSPEQRRQTWRSRAPGSSNVVLESLEPQHLRARALLTERRLLASSVYQDGHWVLLANGEPAPRLLANGPFVAAWLPPGDWRLDLLYRPPVFIAGCLLAALALTAAAARWVPPPSLSRRAGAAGGRPRVLS
ncbi:MAG TPA: YfhO family protein [Thermoanaerobaculia bacterium]|nr:YfhO family protein [Thermoanaerobaculia bacterium]